MSGYHIGTRPGRVPCILKDGGTGSWREAKKIVRQWYLEEAKKLRGVTAKTYFVPEVQQQLSLDYFDHLDN